MEVLRKDQRVRVVDPAKHHRHTLGWEGRISKESKGGYWQVTFASGKALFHGRELKPLPEAREGGAVHVV
jgi:hypothetical protein